MARALVRAKRFRQIKAEYRTQNKYKSDAENAENAENQKFGFVFFCDFCETFATFASSSPGSHSLFRRLI